MFDSHINKYINEETHLEEMKIENKDNKLCEKLTRCNDLDIYDTKAVNDLINYKWKTFGRRFHYIGFLFHSFNVVMLNVYVIQVYISNIEEGKHKPYTIFLICGMFFPFIYELA